MNTLVRQQIKRLTHLPPPLIIVGCHRSGTSLLVTLLRQNRCFFGDDLLVHEESPFFLKCNDYLLKRVHASWDRPQPFLDRGGEAATPDDLLRHAQIDHEIRPYQYMGLASFVTVRLGFCRSWGWKDPRTSVTLPFWLRLFPEGRVLHIVRHGLDVALSLNKREKGRKTGSPLFVPDLVEFRNCFRLWTVYEQAVAAHVAALRSERYLRIRYEDLLASDAATLLALQDFLGHPVDVRGVTLEKENTGKFWGELGEGARDYLKEPLLRELGYV